VKNAPKDPLLKILAECLNTISDDDEVWDYIKKDELINVIKNESNLDRVNIARLASSLTFYSDLKVKNTHDGIFNFHDLFPQDKNI
jgi:hypothetical protein